MKKKENKKKGIKLHRKILIVFFGDEEASLST